MFMPLLRLIPLLSKGGVSSSYKSSAAVWEPLLFSLCMVLHPSLWGGCWYCFHVSSPSSLTFPPGSGTVSLRRTQGYTQEWKTKIRTLYHEQRVSILPSGIKCGGPATPASQRRGEVPFRSNMAVLCSICM